MTTGRFGLPSVRGWICLFVTVPAGLSLASPPLAGTAAAANVALAKQNAAMRIMTSLPVMAESRSARFGLDGLDGSTIYFMFLIMLLPVSTCDF
jgi:hypothetical protein